MSLLVMTGCSTRRQRTVTSSVGNHFQEVRVKRHTRAPEKRCRAIDYTNRCRRLSTEWMKLSHTIFENEVDHENESKLQNSASPDLQSWQMTLIWMASCPTTSWTLLSGVSRLPSPQRVRAKSPFWGWGHPLFHPEIDVQRCFRTFPLRQRKTGKPQK